jgi:putative ABC transport system permease protein
MILKNLFRRKFRTALTILGISIGVAAIVGLGALANGLKAGYDSFLTGSKADLVLSQPDAFDVSLSAVDESVGQELEAMSEVSEVSGMLQGFVQTEGVPYFFIYGYPEDSFALGRFQIVEGASLDSREAQTARGKPVLLGASAADVLNKNAGDTLRVMDKVFRVVGIYETGETLEDNGAVLGLRDAQDLLGRQRQVSLFYIQLKDSSLRERVERRCERLWPDLELSGTEAYADKQMMGDFMEGYVWGIAGLAIVIGGVGMMNAQLMAVMERTREIGVLKAIGWSNRRVLGLILGESIAVGLVGGSIGIIIGWLFLTAFSGIAGFFGASAANVDSGLIIQAYVVVLILGLVGGLYPAWRASRMQPVEALRYEGGTQGGAVHRLPAGGMAVQNLWQRKARTFLTLGVIGLTVGSIMALEAIVRGAMDIITAMSAEAEIMVRQAGIADTGYSALDERIGDRLAAYPEVAYVNGVVFTGTFLPDSGMIFVIFGYAPNEQAIRSFNVVEGERLRSNHQIMLGRMMAEALNKKVGDVMELGSSRFKIVAIYESGATWEELGGVISMRDAQTYMGRPRKVSLYSVKVNQPSQAASVVEKINADNPEAHAALSGEFAEQMPDMQTMDGLMAAISILAIFVGGVGVMNTMLMAVLERTREIGVLRALGWRRRLILKVILLEALWLGILGGAIGILVAFGLNLVYTLIPYYGSMLEARWEMDIFVRAITIALLLGVLGGVYPAYRATRLQPVEALRYE